MTPDTDFKIVLYFLLVVIFRKCYSAGGVAQWLERRSFAGELSMSCARLAADGRPLMWVSHPLHVSQPGQLSLSFLRGR